MNLSINIAALTLLVFRDSLSTFARTVPPSPPAFTGAAVSRICHGAPVRQPGWDAASRKNDGGAAEGSIFVQ